MFACQSILHIFCRMCKIGLDKTETPGWWSPGVWLDVLDLMGQIVHLRGQVLPDDLDQLGLALISQPVPHLRDPGKVRIFRGKHVGKPILVRRYSVAAIEVMAFGDRSS